MKKDTNKECDISFLYKAHLLDLDPKTLGLESLLRFRAALMHKLIMVNVEVQNRSKILAELSEKKLPDSEKEFIIFVDELKRACDINAFLIPEFEHIVKS